MFNYYNVIWPHPLQIPTNHRREKVVQRQCIKKCLFLLWMTGTSFFPSWSALDRCSGTVPKSRRSPDLDRAPVSRLSSLWAALAWTWHPQPPVAAKNVLLCTTTTCCLSLSASLPPPSLSSLSRTVTVLHSVVFDFTWFYFLWQLFNVI